MTDQIPIALQVIVFIILGIAGAAYLVSFVRRDSHQETRHLAETRGKRIDDLEEALARLKVEMADLRAAFQAYKDLKHEEIAVEVARLLEPRLPIRDDLS